MKANKVHYKHLMFFSYQKDKNVYGEGAAVEKKLYLEDQERPWMKIRLQRWSKITYAIRHIN